MSDKRWRVRIYNQNSTSLSTSNVYWQTTALASPVTVRGPIIRPTLGRAESQPWTVDILDDGSSVTAHLADSSGRSWLLGRILSVERSLGGAFSVQGSGRITDVLLNPNIATYQMVVEDERRVERNATIFNTTNTTRLYPGGPGVRYGPWPAAQAGKLKAVRRRNVRAVQIDFDRTSIGMFADQAFQVIRDDLVGGPLLDPTSNGNFKTVRCRIGTQDFGIITFGTQYDPTPGPSRAWFDDLDHLQETGIGIRCWLWATSSQLSVGTNYQNAFLHMYAAPPSAATPLHIGSSVGLTPPAILKNVYDGLYSTAGTPKVRYSTAAFDALALQTGWPRLRFRITEPANMSDWLEENIYRPFLIAPLIDTQGRVAPTSLKLPNSTGAITYTFTGSNLRQPYPTWQHLSRDQVTRLRFRSLSEWVPIPTVQPVPAPASGGMAGVAADLIAVQTSTFIADHDRIADFGIRELPITVAGMHSITPLLLQNNPGLPPAWDEAGLLPPEIHQYVSWVSRDLFDRYGDGPIMGTLAALSSAESQGAGKWAKIALDSFPNPSLASRGGTRMLQLLSRDDPPEGPEFSYLDGGNNLAGLAAPTLTLSTSTADAKHSLIATVGSVPAAGGYRLEMINAAASPGSSAAWTPVMTQTATAGAQRIGGLAAGVKYWMRAQNQQASRLRSGWTLSTGKTTASIVGPSALGSTSITSNSVGLVWTPGDIEEMTDIHVNTSTSVTITSTNRTVRIPIPNTARYTVTRLSAGTKYLFAVRHADPYGGYSTSAKITATTLSTAVGGGNNPPAPLGITILLGQDSQ